MTHILQLKINVNWVKHLLKKKMKKKKGISSISKSLF